MTSRNTVALPTDFGFGDDEALLRDTARRFLSDELPTERLRKLVAGDVDAVYERGERPGWDEGLWRKMVELGWSGLAVPEALGGSGCKLVGIAALLEEVGRAAAPSPLSATLAATYVLCAAADLDDGERVSPWLQQIATGMAMTLAWMPADGSRAATDTTVRLTRNENSLQLDGATHFVQDAFKVDTILVIALDGDVPVLVAVPADAPELSLQQEHIVDLTRDQASARFTKVTIGESAVVSRHAAAALESAWPALLVIAAADLCGSAEWQLQTTVEYAKTRVQFDRPIGFFQAVKHPLVNGMVDLDRARSLLYHAACCIDGESPDAAVAARMAKSAAGDAGAFLSDRSVQLHGGIGFTWECDVHLYFKRSLHTQALYGNAIDQRRELAEFLIDSGDR